MDRDKIFLPQNTVIVCDLHGVVFSSSIRQIMRVVWQCPHKVRFLRLITDIPLACKILYGVRKKYVIERMIHEFSGTHALFNQFKDIALAVANAQKVDKKTVTLLERLKQNNYQLIAFSNIGQESIGILKERHPAIFNLFDHVVHTSVQDNFVAKPDIRAFEKLFACLKDTHTNVIFIDDARKNLEQSRELGLYPLKFKNACSLERALVRLHILTQTRSNR